MVDRLVLDDGEQQRLEGHFGQQRRAVFPDPHQRILHQLLGAGRSDETGGVGAEGFIIAAEERVETFFVPGTQQADNRTVVLHVDCLHVISHKPGYSHDSAAAGDGISLLAKVLFNPIFPKKFARAASGRPARRMETHFPNIAAPEAGIPPNFITFAVQVRSVAAGRGRERKVRATQSAAQANDLISVRV